MKKAGRSAAAGPAPVHGGGEREALVWRWLDLTRRVLPDLAGAHRWPIRLDHCFMRVRLDVSLGRPWRELVAAPAVRHLSDAQLRAAVAIAEAAAVDPERLPALNRESLRLRGRFAAR